MLEQRHTFCGSDQFPERWPDTLLVSEFSKEGKARCDLGEAYTVPVTDFVLLGTSDNVWRCFWLSHLEEMLFKCNVVGGGQGCY